MPLLTWFSRLLSLSLLLALHDDTPLVINSSPSPQTGRGHHTSPKEAAATGDSPEATQPTANDERRRPGYCECCSVRYNDLSLVSHLVRERKRESVCVCERGRVRVSEKERERDLVILMCMLSHVASLSHTHTLSLFLVVVH